MAKTDKVLRYRDEQPYLLAKRTLEWKFQLREISHAEFLEKTKELERKH